MNLQKAKLKDIPSIMEIINSAREQLAANNIEQWQGSYPDQSIFRADIIAENCYIIKNSAKLIAVAVISLGDDPSYQNIYQGEWLSTEKYGVIHRIAVTANYQGQSLASLFIKKAEEIALSENIKSIRIDTHRDNLAMQNLLKKNKFKYCGIIYTLREAERLAFEKLLV